MDSLNTIPNSGSFGDVSAKLNDNFLKVGQSLTTLENVAIANKGYFDTLASLQAAFPSPRAGNIAYVENVASSTGYYIYNVVSGVWTATTTEAPAVGVAISNYAQHGYSSSPKTLKQVDDEVVQLAGEAHKKDTFPYDNSYPFRSDLITKKIDKWLINAYLDIEYEEGFRYSFSVINKTNKTASLYKHVDGQPALGNVTSIGLFKFEKIENSRFYLGKLVSQPNSWVIADFDNIEGDVSNIFYYDGIGLSPRIFKNEGTGSVGGSIKELQDDVALIKPSTTIISEIAEKNFTLENAQGWGTDSFTNKDDSSTFSGWGCHIGALKNFDAVEICVINRDSVNPITKIRVAIYDTNYGGTLLANNTLTGINVLPGATKYIVVPLEQTITNDDNRVLFLMYWCDQIVTRRAYEETYEYTEANGYEKDRYAYNGNMTTASPVSGRGRPFYFRVGLANSNYQLTEEQIQNISERIAIEPPPAVETIGISLPDKIYAIVGDTLQLFYRGMIKSPNPYIYNILITCGVGKQYPRYFEYSPTIENIGTTTFKVEVKDKDGNILGSKTCNLVTKAAVQAPATDKIILCVGDSLTRVGTWCIEASRRLIGTGGTPAGLGLSNISFLGRKTGSGIGWEGNGGWTWDSYSTVGREAYKFYVSGVTTAPSMGATYANNGVTYTISEINITAGTGYVSATGAGAPTASGTLTKVTGDGDATLTFSSSEADAGNPFWGSDTNSLDFPQYVNTYMNGGCDAIYFLLSWNGQTQHRTDFTSVINSAKVLVDHIHTNYPNCKMKIMGIQVPSLNGGMGANYGATGTSYADTYGMVVTALNMNKAYQDWCNEAAYSSFLEFVNVSAQFDSENNMLETDKAVNTRSAKTEKIGTNGVHPSTEGYYQIGDVVFRNFVANFCQ